MPASMVAAITILSGGGRPKRVYVSVPFISGLLDEPGFVAGRKYLVLPDEPEPPAPRPTMKPGPKERKFRELGPALEE